MQVRRALFFYCITAIGVLLLVGWYVVTSAGRVGGELALARADIEPVEQDAQHRRQIVSQLEDDQRRLRSELNPADAIDFSAAIQRAQIERDRVEAGLADLTAHADALAEEYNARRVRVVPVIALLLVHGLGVFLFSPRGGNGDGKAPRRRRRAVTRRPAGDNPA